MESAVWLVTSGLTNVASPDTWVVTHTRGDILSRGVTLRRTVTLRRGVTLSTEFTLSGGVTLS